MMLVHHLDESSIEQRHRGDAERLVRPAAQVGNLQIVGERRRDRDGWLRSAAKDRDGGDDDDTEDDVEDEEVWSAPVERVRHSGVSPGRAPPRAREGDT